MPPLTEANFAARVGRVSASEVGALMPEGHPYLTPLDVYRRLVGDPFGLEPSEAMRLGTILEPAILAAAADRYGWRVRANARTFLHRTAPLCATPDAHRIGTRDLVEVKYSGNPSAWTGLPPHVYYQAQAQLACTGYRRVHVVVLAGGLRVFVVERDQTAINRLCAASRAMLARVAAGATPEATPPPDRSTLVVDDGRRTQRPASLDRAVSKP